jgi:hypothetical protein
MHLVSANLNILRSATLSWMNESNKRHGTFCTFNFFHSQPFMQRLAKAITIRIPSTYSTCFLSLNYFSQTLKRNVFNHVDYYFIHSVIFKLDCCKTGEILCDKNYFQTKTFNGGKVILYIVKLLYA